MKIPRLALLLALTAAASTFAADLNVVGNLTVTGSVDSDANTTSFGAQSTVVPTQPGVLFTYTDSTTDTLKFLINRNPASWLWVHNTSVPAMRLDSSHNLLLYPLGANLTTTPASITLTPATSTVGAALSLGNATGTQTTAPKLTLGSATLSSVGTTSALSTNGALTIAGNLTNSNASAVTSFMGNVGIKTASPDKSLHVSFDSASVPAVKIGSGTDAQGWYTFLGNDLGGSTTSYIGNAFNNDAAKFQIRMKGTAAASARLTVLGNGNVGIGTTSPGVKLSVNGSASIGGADFPAGTNSLNVFSGNVAGNSGWLRVGQSAGTGLEAGWYYNSIPANAYAAIATYGNGNPLRIDASTLALQSQSGGNVGIGTANPGAALEVYRASGGASSLRLNTGFAGGNTVDLNPFITGINNGGFELAVAGARRLVIDPSGNVGIGTTNPTFKLDVLNDNYNAIRASGNSSNSVGIYVQNTTANGRQWALLSAGGGPAGGVGSFSIWDDSGGGNRFNITPAGNVGIGTTIPAYKLSVTGDVKITSPTQSKLLFSNQEAVVFASLEYDDTNGNFNMINPRGYPLRFLTNNTERVRFDASGNVGIGTTSPQTRMQLGSYFDGTGETAHHGDLLFSKQNTSLAAIGGIEWKIASDNYGAKIDTIAAGGANIVFGLRNNSAAWTEAMRINPSGNVGIGTPSPTAKLHVFTSAQTKAVFGRDDGMAAENSLVRINTAGASNYSGIGFDAAASPTSGAAIWMQTNGNGLYMSGSATYANLVTTAPHMSVTPAGNVGIGTTTPVDRLSLETSANGSGRVRALSSLHTANNTIQIDQFGQSHPNRPAWNIIGVSNAEQGLGFVTDSQANINAGTSLLGLFIKSGGNVGIGTIAPTHKLSVKGTIRAQEIIVDNTNWADYVFDESYALAPLGDVEAHIKAKKHLPGIPSAAEIAEHGVSMGDMQSKLLSKIEELTLHMIAQEKRIERLEQENKQLKAATQP